MLNREKIAEAKFRRDGKGLKKTALIGSLNFEMADVYRKLTSDIGLTSNEGYLIFYYNNVSQWYIITTKKIINKNLDSYTIIKFQDVIRIISPIYTQHFLLHKMMGLDYIEFELKDRSVFKLYIEIGSFAVIDGVLSVLL